MKENDVKRKTKKSNKKKESVNNAKHQNNKILKAKDILAKNKAALEKQAKRKHDAEQLSLPRRILRYVKRTFLIALIATVAVLLVSFVVIRIQGGTPELFGYSVQRIVSGSMEPTLQVGDIILSKSIAAPEDIKADDIITFQGGKDFDYNKVTHRVLSPPIRNTEGVYTLVTKGDANERVDEEIGYDAVISKYVTKIDILNKFYELFLSPWGLIVFIAVLLIIFFDELLTIVKVMTGNYNEEDEEEDESVREIMERIKREEEEQRLAEERKRKRHKKNQNTSRKKLKRLSEKKPKNQKKPKRSGKPSEKHAKKKAKKKKK